MNPLARGPVAPGDSRAQAPPRAKKSGKWDGLNYNHFIPQTSPHHKHNPLRGRRRTDGQRVDYPAGNSTEARDQRNRRPTGITHSRLGYHHSPRLSPKAKDNIPAETAGCTARGMAPRPHRQDACARVQHHVYPSGPTALAQRTTDTSSPFRRAGQTQVLFLALCMLVLLLFGA